MSEEKIVKAPCALCEGEGYARSRKVFGRDGVEKVSHFVDCPTCDRGRCPGCREYIADKRAKKCPCGYRLPG